MSVSALARRVAGLLQRSERKVVFAESCTGGLVSGALTQIPGISEWHCGGMIVYRNPTKIAYLGLPAKVLEEPGPVSAEVARRMVQAVLKRTPEADVAISVTGHLGPGAPPELDGQVFVGVATRRQAAVCPLRCRTEDSRLRRQKWVVEQALAILADALERKRL